MGWGYNSQTFLVGFSDSGTPLDDAEQNGHDLCVKLLQVRGPIYTTRATSRKGAGTSIFFTFAGSGGP